MATNHLRTLGGNLHVLDLEAFMLSPLDLDHQIQSNLLQGIKDNLVGLTGFHPGDIIPLYAGMNVCLQVAPRDRPAFGQSKDQEVARSKKKVPGGDNVLFQLEGHA